MCQLNQDSFSLEFEVQTKLCYKPHAEYIQMINFFLMMFVAMTNLDSFGSQMSPLTDKSFYQEAMNVYDKSPSVYLTAVRSYPVHLETRQSIKQEYVSDICMQRFKGVAVTEW